MANSVDPDQTSPVSELALFAETGLFQYLGLFSLGCKKRDYPLLTEYFTFTLVFAPDNNPIRSLAISNFQ